MNATATGAQLVRLPADFLAALRRALAAGRSPLEAATLLRQTGYETGPSLHAALKARLAEERGEAGSLSSAEFWEAFGAFWESLGWGGVRHEPLHPGVAALDSADWAEADAGGHTGHPSCHFTTGVLAEVLSRIAGEDVAVLEVECRSAGDGRCRFLFGGEAALGEVYGRMAAGLPYTEAVEQLR